MSEGPVLFSLECPEPLPGSVAIAGEFNAWAPAPLPYSEVSKKFETTLVLTEGKNYSYKFVVDGNWILDPKAESVWDNGIENSIVRVTAEKFVAPAPPPAAAEEGYVMVDSAHEVKTAETAETVAVEEAATPAVETESSGGLIGAMTGLANSAIAAATGAVENTSAAVLESVEVAKDFAASKVTSGIETVKELIPETPSEVPDVTTSEIGGEPAEVPEANKAEETVTATGETVAEDAAKIAEHATVSTEKTIAEVVASVPEATASTDKTVAEVVHSVPEAVASAESAIAATAPADAEPAEGKAHSELSSLERVGTANTNITTPELATPVKEDSRKHVPDVPAAVAEASSDSSTGGATSEIVKDTAVAGELSSGADTAVPIEDAAAEEPIPKPPAGYETAQKSTQPGILDKIYEFISTSILGKLFQYIFSIFNRSA